ncbi:uncharacterized protein LOC105689254 [Athalia rosae]|uniref:uncharacterized protein LOC105689254 n=1 Tax=Athalia rosae TaxID=37344 RepID=UPI002033B4B2|nr:uncharacterized protein LOC105689254 [Athalia rosae]
MCRSISFRLSLLVLVVYLGPLSLSKNVEGTSAVGNPGGSDSPIFETVHTSNAAIFNRLGLSPLRISQGHHKKRLAGPEPPLNFASQGHLQSYGRRHGHRDSHVYIVKLPPSLPYYAITRPHKESKTDVNVVRDNANFPVGFQSNGKPGGIYHWNLPVMKKMAEKKRIVEHRLQQVQKQKEKQENLNDVGTVGKNTSNKTEEGKKESPANLTRVKGQIGGNDLPEVDKRPADNIPVVKHVRNNDKRLNYSGKEFSNGDARKGTSSGMKQNFGTGNKNFRLDDSVLYRIKPDHKGMWNGAASSSNPHNSIYNIGNTVSHQKQLKKHRKKSAMSYYAPFSLKSGSTSLHKNFSGNGKPKAFYVIEKSRKPVYYHPLLP